MSSTEYLESQIDRLERDLSDAEQERDDLQRSVDQLESERDELRERLNSAVLSMEEAIRHLER